MARGPSLGQASSLVPRGPRHGGRGPCPAPASALAAEGVAAAQRSARKCRSLALAQCAPRMPVKGPAAIFAAATKVRKSGPGKNVDVVTAKICHDAKGVIDAQSDRLARAA